jgi:hypothetical protein
MSRRPRWYEPLILGSGVALEREHIAQEVRRIDHELVHGDLDHVERIRLSLLRQAVAKLSRDQWVGQGGKELPPEAHHAVAALEQIYAQEVQKPKAERRTMKQIAEDYARTAIMATLVTPKQLLKLWKHTREKAAAEGKEAARGKP